VNKNGNGSNFDRSLIRGGAGREVLPRGPEVIEYPWQPLDNDDTVGSEHLHWTVQVYASRDKDGRLSDVTLIHVEGPDEDTALKRAMRQFQRPGYAYRVADVTEVCQLDEALTRTTQETRGTNRG